MAAAPAASTRWCSPAAIGEHRAEIRARAADALGVLGIRVDRERNAGCVGETDISGPRERRSGRSSFPRVRTWEMARQARELLAER